MDATSPGATPHQRQTAAPFLAAHSAARPPSPGHQWACKPSILGSPRSGPGPGYTASTLHSLGIAHRDVKSENLLYASPPRSGGTDDVRIPKVKLIDFGLARRFEGRSLSSFCGTAAYAPPEMVNDQPCKKPAFIFVPYASLVEVQQWSSVTRRLQEVCSRLVVLLDVSFSHVRPLSASSLLNLCFLGPQTTRSATCGARASWLTRHSLAPDHSMTPAERLSSSRRSEREK